MSSAFCGTDPDGWGPTSATRIDLTFCFENSILLTIPAVIAIFTFLIRIYFLYRKETPHQFGRTWLIYIPSQLLILGASGALIARAVQLSNDSEMLSYSIATMLGTSLMAVAWLLAALLNEFETRYNIRSSSYVFGYQVISLVASAITIRTMHDMNQVDEQQFTTFMVFFGLAMLAFIVQAWPRGRTTVQKVSGASQYEKANLFSRLTFHYLQHLVGLGYKKPLAQTDVEGLMPKRLRTEYSHDHLNDQWKSYVAKKKSKGQPISLMKLILVSYNSYWIPILTLRFCVSILTYIQPELLNQLLGFLTSYDIASETPQPVSLGIILAFGLFFCSSLVTFIQAQFYVQAINMGLEIRTALIAMIYRKSLRLSSAAKQKSTTGEIANHLSVDAERWVNATTFMPLLVFVPIEVGIAIWMLYQQISWSIFVGLGTIFVVVPIQGFLAKFFQRAKSEKLKAMDIRVRLMNEILANIKVVKLYGWEESFQEKIAHVRNKELSTLRRIGIAFSFIFIIFGAMPMLIALVSLSVYATVGGPNMTPGNINAQTIFVSITLFGMLARPISMLSHVIGETIGVSVATGRISKFLLAEEVTEDAIDRIALPGAKVAKGEQESVEVFQNAIEINNGTFAWVKSEEDDIETEKEKLTREKLEDKKFKEEEKDALKQGKPAPVRVIPAAKDYSPTMMDINLEIPRGKLTAVVGRVGMGKTSLLSAMIGDMYKRSGTVKIQGRMAYAAQQAWIINATLRDNITFGMVFDQEKYDHVVFCCGLQPDIEMLPAGDQTEIGERGINLSGGQKQRVSLARAAYQDADIYLLDDPLSAVDAHVDQHLWNNLIGPEGLLKDKTRVLVTHGINHLAAVDQIVVVKGGKIDEHGQYDDLMSAQQSFYTLIKEYSVNEGRKQKKSKDTNAAAAGEGGSNSSVVDDDDSTQDGDAQSAKDEKTVGAAKKDDKAELVSEEKMMLGSVSWNVYKVYGAAASFKIVGCVLAMFVASQATQIGCNLWLQRWTASGANVKQPGYYLGIYAALIILYIILSVSVTYLLMVVAAVRASRRLHEQLLDTMLRLPMSFMDTTPLGRIVNRFSSDVFAIDETLPWTWMYLMICGVSVCGTMIVIASSTPIFLVMVPPLGLAYTLIQQYYMRSSRALKRIDSVAKSPIYQHFSETLTGVSTIRAMYANERFINENAAKTNISTNAYFSWAASNRWLQIRLESLGAVIVLAAAMFVVLGRKSIAPSMAGLALSYALSVTQDITWLVRSYCDLQNQLVSVERIDEYIKKNPEAPVQTAADTTLPLNWPQNGQIVFKNYSTRYREGLDLVIRNLDFTVQAGEKIGIVGRTGAGKSSLTLALFRIVEAANSHWAKASHNGSDSDADPSKEKDEIADLEKVNVDEDGGSIWIDGVDISTVGLRYLRQHLAIIPQDPTLFAGTLRENLDPFNEMQDADLWEALERAHLKDHITTLAGGLSFKVSQGGDNFSVGQRSLICLARALLRKTKVLILDEATSAVDVQTDELIQKTIRSEFKDRTILTIAHRLKTVMDSDKILVMDKGQVEEFEPPAVLLQREESLFYKLAEQAGEIKSGVAGEKDL